MRINADTRRCVGAGMCALTLPEVFDQSEDDGTVVVLDPRPSAAVRAAVERAVQLCPSGALSLLDDPPGAPAPERLADVTPRSDAAD